MAAVQELYFNPKRLTKNRQISSTLCTSSQDDIKLETKVVKWITLIDLKGSETRERTSIKNFSSAISFS